MDRRPGKPRSIAVLFLVPGLVLLVLVVAVGIGLAWLNERTQIDDETRTKVRDLAITIAVDDAVNEQLAALVGSEDNPRRRAAATAVLQPYAEYVRTTTDLDFVVVMVPDGTRLTHPTEAEIGHTYLGDRTAALAGSTYDEIYEGTLGLSTRAISPVVQDGRIVGMVAVGISQAATDSLVLERSWPLVIVGVLAMLLGLAGVIGIGRWLRRQTLGLDALALERTVTFHDAGLDASREGMIVVDVRGRPMVMNRPARELLQLEEVSLDDAEPESLGLPAEIVRVLREDVAVTELPVLVGDRLLVVTRRPAIRDGRMLGAVVTVADHTELQHLADEVDQLQGFTRALRAQAHESANRLHTVVSLLELGEADVAVELVTDELHSAQALADHLVDGVNDRALAALLLGKAAQAADRRVTLRLGEVAVPPDVLRPIDLVTVVGNLVDNAIDAAECSDGRWVEFTATRAADDVVLTVIDSGVGVPADHVDSVFDHGWTSKGATTTGRGLGLSLVRQTVQLRGGQVVTRPGPGGWFQVRLPVGGPR